MANCVILVIYRWQGVQPGTLSWAFPSVADAEDAVRTMKNAVKWAVFPGSRSGRAIANVDLDFAVARAEGGALLAQAS